MSGAPMTTLPRAPRRPMLATLMIASGLSPLAINVFLPSMTSIARDLAVGPAAVGLGLSLYLAATAAIQLIAGPLSDRFGRRPVILGGMVLFLLGTGLCLMASSIETFLIGRVIQAASATGIVLSRAIVRDLYARDQAASMLGYVTMGLAVAPMLGPAIGGAIDTAFGWRAVFWMLGMAGVLTTVLLFFDLSETNRTRGAPFAAQFRAYGQLMRAGAFWSHASVAAFVSAVFFAFLGSAPFIAVDELGMSPAGYGLWFMLCSVGYITGNFITGRLSQRIGLRPLMRAGAGVTFLAGLVILAFFAIGWVTPLTLFGPMMLVGLGSGLSVPTSTAGGVSVRPDAAGAAAGLLGALQIGLGAVMSVLAAGLAGTPVAAAALMAFMGLAGVLAALSVRRERSE
ncbi:multidrug effflux MFS transporter [Aureimonas populi]|uniref:Bcr/CflA family efflux transporter n=1 Tax=Aureimonas populi TaxID=1701758 RepID=A0ABW5CMR7_9HYPH|nr:multidrug effflux MFS transporter [Aureimonas populi]